MQNQPLLELQPNVDFALQKNFTFGQLEKSFKSKESIQKTIKNSQFFQEFQSNPNHKNILNGNLSTFQEEIQRYETLKRIQANCTDQLSNLKRQASQKDTKHYHNSNLVQPTTVCSEEQLELIPNIQTDFLQTISKLNRQIPNAMENSIEEIEKNRQKNPLENSKVLIDLNLGGQISDMEQFSHEQRKVFNKKLALIQQVAITYVPLKYKAGNKVHIFSKFHQSRDEYIDAISSKSLCSNLPYGENNQLKDCLINSTANFTKLHEIDLFIKRKEIRIERSDELLQANQKLLAGHLIVKEQLQKTKKNMEKIQIQYRNKIEQISQELSLERQSKKHILIEKELKESIIKNIKNLNEQYLKENNQLKEKLKEYIKHMHELKCELTIKRKVQISDQKTDSKGQNVNANCNHSNKSIYLPLPTINSIPSCNELTERNQDANRSKKQVKLQNPSFQAPIHVQDNKIPLQRLNNCASQVNISNIKTINQRKLSSDFVLETSLLQHQNTKSQKSIGIKRNNISQQNISNKNIAKNQPNNNSTVARFGEDQHEKSISSYSNISGMSLSQKVGFVPKPPSENKKGIILDYMSASNNDDGYSQLNSKNERFKYKRQGQ